MQREATLPAERRREKKSCPAASSQKQKPGAARGERKKILDNVPFILIALHKRIEPIGFG
jgi:hypothetical protein